LGIQVHNTLTGKKEEFITRDPGRAAMYVCGPTVYNYIHVGNARCYLTFDMVRRYLRFRGYDVLYVQNFTDVDDKIINQANAEGIPPAELAEKYIEAFLEDMAALQVEPPDVAPKATEHIEEMLEMVESLVAKGIAYEVEGDVYFDVTKFPAYGSLSHRVLEDMQSGARVGVDERKKNPGDFALWKAAKPGEPSWDSPWGAGRPGWHIECSAMSQKYLGFSFDIHGGGLDLIFPHHENEIAQAEGATGKTPFVRYWLHNGFVTMSGEKMAKSVGNVIRVRDALAEADPMAVRTLFLGTHYRSPIDFNDDKLVEAGKAYDRLNNLVGNIDRFIGDYNDPVRVMIGSGKEKLLLAALREAEEAFVTAMDDDFNAPDALGALFTLTREVNNFIKDRKQFSLDEMDALDAAKQTIINLGGALGLTFAGFAETGDAGFTAKVEQMLKDRDAAKAAKDWDAADRIRNELSLMDVVIEDTPEGAKWRIKKGG
jgi:cysteinyl-tRNA synthetase